MKIAVVFTGREAVKSAADRYNLFIQPFIQSDNALELWYLGDNLKERVYLSKHIESASALFARTGEFFAPIMDENRLDALEAFYTQRRPEVLLFWGKDSSLAVRFSLRIGGKCLTHCGEVKVEPDLIQATRRVYNANIDGIYTLKTFPIILTVSKTGPVVDSSLVCDSAPIYDIEVQRKDYSYYIDRRVRQPEGKNPLEEASLVLVAGRGIGSKENYERLKSLAKAWGGACGCTRAVAINGFAPAESIVGQSGRVLRAKLCITFGVSGAGPFMAGVENVKTLAAINIDEKAPIFAGADYGIVGDALDALEVFEKCEKEW